MTCKCSREQISSHADACGPFFLISQTESSLSPQLKLSTIHDLNWVNKMHKLLWSIIACCLTMLFAQNY